MEVLFVVISRIFSIVDLKVLGLVRRQVWGTVKERVLNIVLIALNSLSFVVI